MFLHQCQTTAATKMQSHKASFSVKLGYDRPEQQRMALSFMCVLLVTHHLFSEVGHMRVGAVDGAFGG